ncbi:phosphopentomutase [Rhizobium leguminosarum]|uniref:phosphopentomutase n=1 Tax=Rhizobium leguminosarum TaxID=384 RepID=UPI001C9508FB|nr:phosphopentomutase [Rhizobium leguminosarum]MBY5361835.1 phosphopentomutase [Rhizobium leguminosarum]MBY5664864.1 phosphopentomutase [Rhizobium leguminosarum]MBY5677652.1 phosphopentomutase [Rhizobium leguminosarum]MBY5720875.1 phosphopentomutase [Rhizobium leguminosarum]
MARVFLCVLDSVGCGGAPDAARYGDEGANTLLHIAEACAAGRAEEGRSGLLKVPNLDALGLGAAIQLASGRTAPGLGAAPIGRWGAAEEISAGKDTQSGHWELAGVAVTRDWHYFPRTIPAFPDELMAELATRSGIPGTLANCHASGTEVLDQFGAEHIATGKPIVYTSADSVVQIAAHETHFGLERLLDLCRIAAEIFHPLNVGRIIARPFVGKASGAFLRTANRKDFAIAPPDGTICDRVVAAGGAVHAVGKIGDIFAYKGITDVSKGEDDMALFDHVLSWCDRALPGDLLFANFIEFDSLWGHRRNVAGYARALEIFDARLPELTSRLCDDDLLIITADHGNDPTWAGTDHTRERVPVLMTGPGIVPHSVGVIPFTDVAQIVAEQLGIADAAPQ